MINIVIIGNGFDKAHKLLTGYNDFWNYVKNDTPNKLCFGEFTTFSSFYTVDELNKNWLGFNLNNNTNSWEFGINHNCQTESIYFKSLIDKQAKIENWCDFEKHYFDIIYDYISYPKKVYTINEEFEYLKNLFEDYLYKKVETQIETDKLILKVPIKQILLQSDDNNKPKYDKTYYLMFNYTSKLLESYIKELEKDFGSDKIDITPIHIHGKLKDPDNPIIFGYGDENSEKYKELELIGNNALLENFKTFQYLRASNYDKLLGVINSHQNIHISLVGHSSGLCDKALLRTIFQSPEVKSIEAIYHNDEKEYFKQLYNISRIFDDNTVMRSKVKTLGETTKI